MGPAKTPSLPTLTSILNCQFHLGYTSTDKGKLKYKDPTYNDKRLWVSRLLAQFFHDEVIIVSVDESSFK